MEPVVCEERKRGGEEGRGGGKGGREGGGGEDEERKEGEGGRKEVREREKEGGKGRRRGKGGSITILYVAHPYPKFTAYLQLRTVLIDSTNQEGCAKRTTLPMFIKIHR